MVRLSTFGVNRNASNCPESRRNLGHVDRGPSCHSLDGRAPLYDPAVEIDPGRECPFCGSAAREHEASGCLDRWVHQHLSSQPVSGNEPVPPYSRTPAHTCLDDLIAARVWADGTAAMQTTDGCSIGVLVRSDDSYHHYQVVASAGSLSLAVCRAAVSGLVGSGTSPLKIK
jgi:hypothetical protein